jgi:transposase-like protein
MVCRAIYSFDEPKYSEAFKNEAIQLYLEGNSGCAVGRLKKIGKNTIWGWLREYEEKMDKSDENDVEIIEQDELYTYIKKRKIRRI